MAAFISGTGVIIMPINWVTRVWSRKEGKGVARLKQISCFRIEKSKAHVLPFMLPCKIQHSGSVRVRL